MLKALIFLISMILVFAVNAETKIYKHVDADGNIHYTDVKPDKDAKEADLPGLTIVESTKTEGRIRFSAPKNVEERENLFDDFIIISPLEEEMIQGTGGTVEAVVKINGELPAHYRIRFYIDNVPYGKVQTNVQRIEEVFRGEHQIYAEAIDARSRKVVKTTPKVTFFVRQNSIR
jgi:hypothetical protein